MTSLSRDAMTPPALQEALEEMGGGVVIGVVMAAQVIGVDGNAHDLTMTNEEAPISTLVGLTDLLWRVVDDLADESMVEFDG